MEIVTQRLVDQGVMGIMLILVCLAAAYLFKQTEKVIAQLFTIIETNTRALVNAENAIKKLDDSMAGKGEWARRP